MAADANVSMLLEFIGSQLSREDATRLLKVRQRAIPFPLDYNLTVCQISNNNVEAAASTFFDKQHDPAALQKFLRDSNGGWDDTVFGSGRYGQEDTSASVPSK
jgi:hypothetical protein